jgi:hypothetical protein
MYENDTSPFGKGGSRGIFDDVINILDKTLVVV